eukprot:TRINITY_DN2531_c0_g1_i4.p1 TRINITY_DN2531_c0_g1~~TRINITY_DN2531_c0_g1_i4.p1  ORF type:complete len:776 (-),score=244.59 TRINITY_DN2531_c0_g1_i4:210-2303(-)
MSKYPPSVQENMIAALQGVVLHAEEVGFDPVPLVGALFKKRLIQSSHTAFVLHQISLLMNIAALREDSHGEFTSRRLRLVSELFLRESARICVVICMLFENLINHDQLQHHLVQHSAAKLIVAASSRFPDHSELQHHVCLILMLLSYTTQFVAPLAQQGVIYVGVHALNDSGELFANGLRLIANATACRGAWESMDLQQMTDALVRVLDRTVGDSDSFENCVVSIANLCANRTCVLTALESGLVDIICGLLQQERGSSVETSEAHAKICRLAWKVAFIREGCEHLQRSQLPAAMRSWAAAASYPPLQCAAREALERLGVDTFRGHRQLQFGSKRGGGGESAAEAGSGGAPKPPPRENSKMTFKRKKIVEEILSTEETYVSALIVLSKAFLEPIRASLASSKPLMGEGAMKAVFGPVEVLLELHKVFLSSLGARVREARENEDDIVVGDVFLELANCLKLYNAYISSYDQAVRALSEAMLSSKFKAFVEDQKEQYSSLSISSLLITPIQRIPRYTLLLQQLSENLPPSHEDCTAVGRALDAVLDVMEYLEAQKAKNHAMNEVLEIQQRLSGFDGVLVQPHRLLIREAVMSGGTSVVLLFSDLLLHCSSGKRKEKEREKEREREREKERGQKLHALVSLPLSGVSAVADVGADALQVSSEHRRVLLLRFPSEDLRDHFLVALQTAVFDTRRKHDTIKQQ